MNVFVSYLRKENSRSTLLAAAQAVARLGDSYIDDLEDHVGVERHHTVTAAVRRADVFVAVVTPGYLTTPWTRWEFGVATLLRIPRYALLPNRALVSPASPSWPWSAEFEAELAGEADPEKPPPPPEHPRELGLDATE